MNGNGMNPSPGDSAYHIAMQRQTGLWGGEGQARLRGACVAVGGLGGIGAAAALMLAKAGVGRLRVCDRDTYDLPNVVEQEFATRATVGRAKVDAALDALKEHGTHTGLEGFQADLSCRDACERLVDGASVLVAAVDNAPARIALGRAADRAGIPFVVSANIGWTVIHTCYLPGEYSYKRAWRNPGLKYLDDGYPDMDDRETVLAIQTEWDIWVAVFSGFTPAAMREFVETRPGHYWYAAPPAYFAASMGVNDVLKIITGTGKATCYPGCVFFNMLTHSHWDWNILNERYTALRRVWGEGSEAILSALDGLDR